MKHKLFLSLASLFLACNLVTQSKFNTEGIKITPLEAKWTTPEALSFLDSVTGYNFYCAADWHKTAMALGQKKAFISYLLEKKGLEKLVIESPYAYGYRVNEFLETGDTILLKAITDQFWAFDKHKLDYEISHNSYEFFKWLYAFNETNSTKIKVVGVDMNRYLKGTIELWSLQRFLLKDSLFIKFEKSYSQLEEIITMESPKIKHIKKWEAEFYREFTAVNDQIKEVLGEDYIEFEKNLVAINDILVWDNKKGDAKEKYRENVMIRNFKREIKPPDIIYAQFGLGHILIHDHYKFDTMLAAIEKDKRYSGRAVVVDVHCERCELGTSRTAHAFWPLFEDEDRGYWGHTGLGFFTDEEHDQFIELLNNKNSVIDLRNTAGKLAELNALHQFVVVLF